MYWPKRPSTKNFFRQLVVRNGNSDGMAAGMAKTIDSSYINQ